MLISLENEKSITMFCWYASTLIMRNDFRMTSSIMVEWTNQWNLIFLHEKWIQFTNARNDYVFICSLNKIKPPADFHDTVLSSSSFDSANPHLIFVVWHKTSPYPIVCERSALANRSASEALANSNYISIYCGLWVIEHCVSKAERTNKPHEIEMYVRERNIEILRVKLKAQTIFRLSGITRWVNKSINEISST